MKIPRTLLLLALVSAPFTATAGDRLISPDPVSETDGCQNPEAAFHANGDVVLVDYLGTWKTWDSGTWAQNGGVKNAPCEVTRVYRMSLRGELRWELRLGDGLLERTDRVTGLAAMPDGRTVLSVSDGITREDQYSRTMMIAPQGDHLWTLKTANRSRFVMAIPHVNHAGDLYVQYHSTNFGYEGGFMSVDGSTTYTLRKNQEIKNFVRLDSSNGKVLWDRKGLLIDSNQTDVLAYNQTQKRQTYTYYFEKFNINGKLISKSSPVRLQGENARSVKRFGDHIWMTTIKEHQRPEGKKVAFRDGRLRAFTIAGKQVMERKISDGALIADTTSGAPIRVVSPVDCGRGLERGYSCHTSALQVLTIKDLKDKGIYTRIDQEGMVFDYANFRAKSTSDGVYFSVKTFEGRSPENPGPAVLAGFSPDTERSAEEPHVFAWTGVNIPASPLILRSF